MSYFPARVLSFCALRAASLAVKYDHLMPYVCAKPIVVDATYKEGVGINGTTFISWNDAVLYSHWARPEHRVGLLVVPTYALNDVGLVKILDTPISGVRRP